jgi:hypothetical protein
MSMERNSTLITNKPLANVTFTVLGIMRHWFSSELNKEKFRSEQKAPDFVEPHKVEAILQNQSTTLC